MGEMTRDEVYRLDTMESRLAKTEYLIEATHQEECALWVAWNERIKWEQIAMGFGKTIGSVKLVDAEGKVETMPVAIAVSWALLGGHLVAFYEATSQVVDYRMVEAWIRPKCPEHTDAANFGHCVSHFKLYGRKT